MPSQISWAAENMVPPARSRSPLMVDTGDHIGFHGASASWEAFSVLKEDPAASSPYRALSDDIRSRTAAAVSLPEQLYQSPDLLASCSGKTYLRIHRRERCCSDFVR